MGGYQPPRPPGGVFHPMQNQGGHMQQPPNSYNHYASPVSNMSSVGGTGGGIQQYSGQPTQFQPQFQGQPPMNMAPLPQHPSILGMGQMPQNSFVPMQPGQPLLPSAPMVQQQVTVIMKVLIVGGYEA